MEYSWYYSSNGRLINFTQKDSMNYPCKITKYKPMDSFGDPIEEGKRFIETVNKSPEPKPAPTKDTEFTRLWSKLDNI